MYFTPSGAYHDWLYPWDVRETRAWKGPSFLLHLHHEALEPLLAENSTTPSVRMGSSFRCLRLHYRRSYLLEIQNLQSLHSWLCSQLCFQKAQEIGPVFFLGSRFLPGSVSSQVFTLNNFSQIMLSTPISYKLAAFLGLLSLLISYF